MAIMATTTTITTYFPNYLLERPNTRTHTHIHTQNLTFFSSTPQRSLYMLGSRCSKKKKMPHKQTNKQIEKKIFFSFIRSIQCLYIVVSYFFFKNFQTFFLFILKNSGQHLGLVWHGLAWLGYDYGNLGNTHVHKTSLCVCVSENFR